MQANFNTMNRKANSPDTFSDAAIIKRIRSRLKELRIKPIDLNKRLVKSKGWIYNYLRGERDFDRDFIELVAQALECNPDWLHYGDKHKKDIDVSNILQINKTSAIHKDIANKTPKGKMLTAKPLLMWQEAENWKEAMVQAMQEYTTRKIIPAVGIVSEDWFPLPIENDAMSPEYKVGEFITVDPVEKPRAGDLIIVKLLDTQEILFRQFFIEGNNVVLKCLNEQYPSKLTSIDNVKIIGTVLGSYRPRVRPV